MASASAVGESPELTARGVVARYFRVWNDGDLSAMEDLLSTEWVDHAHPERRSAHDVAEAIAAVRASDPTMRIYVDALLGDEHLVTVNGRTETAEGVRSWVWLVRVEDGRMREMWTYRAN